MIRKDDWDGTKIFSDSLDEMSFALNNAGMKEGKLLMFAMSAKSGVSGALTSVFSVQSRGLDVFRHLKESWQAWSHGF